MARHARTRTSGDERPNHARPRHTLDSCLPACLLAYLPASVSCLLVCVVSIGLGALNPHAQNWRDMLRGGLGKPILNLDFLLNKVPTPTHTADSCQPT